MHNQILTWTTPFGLSANANAPHNLRAQHYIDNCKTFTHDGTQIFPSKKDIDYIFMAHDMFTENIGQPAILIVENFEITPPNLA